MSTPRTVAFHTLGCKLNFSETSSIKRMFEKEGFNALKFEDGADMYIINTCSVTDFADKKCRYEVRRALKYNPDAKIIVIGCYAQLKPDEIVNIPGVDLVLRRKIKKKIIKYVEHLSSTGDKGMVVAGDVKEANTFTEAFSFGDRTRTFLKAQDGCNYNCSFCTIPQARGKSRSTTVENAVANAQKIAKQGSKEIVLTGVNLGDFGNGTEVIEGSRPKKEALFIDLIQALDKVDGIERFRISSIEPNLCTDEVIEFVAGSRKFVPHFHIPLQSGSDKILGLMRRRYRKELYSSRIDKIKNVMPHCCIGVDVIVGFPGETEDNFMETYNYLQELNVSYLHVFTYSERANTLAADMKEVVPMTERKRRNEMLRILSDKKKSIFYNQFAGDVRKVLVENSKEEGKLTGFTDNYIKVVLDESNLQINSMVNVQLEQITTQLQMKATSMQKVTA